MICGVQLTAGTCPYEALHALGGKASVLGGTVRRSAARRASSMDQAPAGSRTCLTRTSAEAGRG
jgi:hypothetical protein